MLPDVQVASVDSIEANRCPHESTLHSPLQLAAGRENIAAARLAQVRRDALRDQPLPEIFDLSRRRHCERYARTWVPRN
jgi:hypothetical protein